MFLNRSRMENDELMGLRVGASLVAVVVTAFIAFRVLSLGNQLSAAPPIGRPELLGPAFLFYIGALITYAFVWREIAGRMDGRRPAVVDSVSVFCASWLGRYVPSSLPYLAAKFMMGVRLGHSRAAMGASLVYENLLLVSVALISSSVILPAALLGNAGHPLAYLGAAAAGVSAIALLSPPVVQRGVNAALRLAHRPPLPQQPLLRFRDIGVASAIAAVGITLGGVCFAFVLSAFVHLSLRELIAGAAIFNLAAALGILALPVPSGLGVREGVLVALLQLLVPLDVAVASAVVIRLLGAVADVVVGVAGVGVFAFRRSARAEFISDSTAGVNSYPLHAHRNG